MTDKLRVYLNFVFRAKNDQFFVLLEHVFEGIAKAIAEKTGFINAEKGLFEPRL